MFRNNNSSSSSNSNASTAVTPLTSLKYKERFDENGVPDPYGHYDRMGLFRGYDMYYNTDGTRRRRNRRSSRKEEDEDDEEDEDRDEEEAEADDDDAMSSDSESSGEYPPGYFEHLFQTRIMPCPAPTYPSPSGRTVTASSTQFPAGWPLLPTPPLQATTPLSDCERMRRQAMLSGERRQQQQQPQQQRCQPQCRQRLTSMQLILDDIKAVLSRPDATPTADEKYADKRLCAIKTVMTRYDDTVSQHSKKTKKKQQSQQKQKKGTEAMVVVPQHHNKTKRPGATRETPAPLVVGGGDDTATTTERKGDDGGGDGEEEADVQKETKKRRTTLVMRSNSPSPPPLSPTSITPPIVDAAYMLRIDDTDCFNCALCDLFRLTEIRITSWATHCESYMHKMKRESAEKTQKAYGL
jgi:hypothetical protein